jgi:hypothetical protein
MDVRAGLSMRKERFTAENFFKSLDKRRFHPYHRHAFGDVAQLAERRVRNAEARGSTPLISTIYDTKKLGSVAGLFSFPGERL